MQLCPRCRLEARISNSKTIVKGGRAFKVYDLICANNSCQFGASGLPFRRVSVPYPENEIDESVKVCECGAVLCRLGDEIVISPDCTSEIDESTLAVTCGACGAVSTFDI